MTIDQIKKIFCKAEDEPRNARKAIYFALLSGRHLSQMDCKEFEIEDMRTPLSHMKSKFANDGYSLQSKWVKTPKGRNIKEYWLEQNERS